MDQSTHTNLHAERPRVVASPRWLALASIGLVVAMIYYGALTWGIVRAGQALFGW